MVIVMGAITVYFTAAAVLVDVQERQGTAGAQAGIRVQERLVDDVLRNETSDALLAPGCARSFFAQSGNRTCGFRDRGTGQTYLRGVLGVSGGYDLNVTIADEDGVLDTAHQAGESDYRHAIGPAVPPTESATVYYRTVSFGTDDDGDGRIDYYTVTVRLWEVA